MAKIKFRIKDDSSTRNELEIIHYKMPQDWYSTVSISAYSASPFDNGIRTLSCFDTKVLPKFVKMIRSNEKQLTKILADELQDKNGKIWTALNEFMDEKGLTIET